MLSSHPEGHQPENSMPNGDVLLVEYVLQVVVVGVGDDPAIKRRLSLHIDYTDILRSYQLNIYYLLA